MNKSVSLFNISLYKCEIPHSSSFVGCIRNDILFFLGEVGGSQTICPCKSPVIHPFSLQNAVIPSALGTVALAKVPSEESLSIYLNFRHLIY
jgi:hypothetical protein